jgi:hypothetical protein
MRLAMLGGLAAMALAPVACGGRGGGSVKYAPTVVPIKHFDFSGINLGVGQFQHPPGVDQYPAVVATVNGQPVTGEALARQEVAIESSKRSAADLAARIPDPRPGITPATQTPKDPLDGAIDEQLKQQAIRRLGLLPPHAEAVQYTRDQEATIEKGWADATPELRDQEIAMLRDEGFPASDWGSSDVAVSFYSQLMALMKLGSVCSKYRTPVPRATQPPVSSPSSNVNAIAAFASTYVGSTNCSGFLASERKHADIVYYVRWAD